MQHAELRIWPGAAMQKPLVLFPHPCFPSSWISVAPSRRTQACVIPHLPTPVTLCPAHGFSPVPDLPATIVKVVELLLEPLVVSVLLSGRWRNPGIWGWNSERRNRREAAPRAAAVQELSPSCCPRIVLTPLLFLLPPPPAALMQVTQAGALCSWLWGLLMAAV